MIKRVAKQIERGKFKGSKNIRNAKTKKVKTPFCSSSIPVVIEPLILWKRHSKSKMRGVVLIHVVAGVVFALAPGVNYSMPGEGSKDGEMTQLAQQIDALSQQESASIKITGEPAERQNQLAEATKPASAKYKPGDVFRDKLKEGGEAPDMVVIPAGKFRMGDILGTGLSRELPVHEVTINKPFALGRFELTFEEYDRFALATGRKMPSDEEWGRGNRPVINVSWNDALAYTVWLSEQTGYQYRLPSEAEWEYAARAGTETDYWWGNDISNYGEYCEECNREEEDEQTAPVGSYKPNAYGLYDTAGNVFEWVQDCYDYDYHHAKSDSTAFEMVNCKLRTLRGYARSAFRDREAQGYISRGIGIRVARSL